MHVNDSSPIRLSAVVCAIALLVVGMVAMKGVTEHVDANEIVVIQSPVSGNLAWYTTAGIKMQWFGKVTRYTKRSQFWFSSAKDQGQVTDQSIKVRFNDGGHAQISGSISWEMPMDDKHLSLLHTNYGSHEAIEQQLIRTTIEKAVYMTGPLMSSKESYAERRNQLLQFIEDQVQNGIFATMTEAVEQTDPLSGEKHSVNVVKIVEKDGKVVRSSDSPLTDFGIKSFNPSINSITYDEVVEKQIQQQQAAVMQVQTAMAEAKKAEQAAITAEKNGQAEAAKAKWEQEVIKAKVVTEGQQKLEVAKLDTQTAEQYKLKRILEADADAEYRRRVMVADGALEQKLKAYVDVNHDYAEAIARYTGQWVPAVSMGQQGSGSPSQELISMLMAKTARELSLDLALPKNPGPATALPAPSSSKTSLETTPYHASPSEPASTEKRTEVKKARAKVNVARNILEGGSK